MLKKSLVGFGLVVMVSASLVGCGSDGVKGDDSMEGALKQAKKDHPDMKPEAPKSSSKMPTASAANNGPATP